MCALALRFFILPYIDQAPLYNQTSSLNLQGTACSSCGTAAAWRAVPVHMTVIRGYICPSETAGPVTTGSVSWAYSPQTAAMTSYWGSAGPAATHPTLSVGCGVCGASSTNCPCTETTTVGHMASDFPNGGSGMFSLRATSVGLRDVTDGTSNTIFVGEAKRQRGSGGAENTGVFFQWTDPWSTISTNQGINTPGFATAYYNNRFSSYHVGGAHFLLVDGSVRFVSENIDLRTLGNIGTKAGGEVIGEF